MCEFFLGLGGGVLIGVQLLRQFVIGFLDLLGVGVFGHAQKF
jgi:uncharacterized membrane protein YedE/YeeE